VRYAPDKHVGRKDEQTEDDFYIQIKKLTVKSSIFKGKFKVQGEINLKILVLEL
jgi:hypothetical protein